MNVISLNQHRGMSANMAVNEIQTHARTNQQWCGVGVGGQSDITFYDIILPVA